VGQPEEPKSFLEEAFEHHQRAIAPEDLEDASVDTAADADVIPAGTVDIPAGTVDSVRAGRVEESIAVSARATSVPLSTEDHALVDEALKKSGLVWVQTATAPAGRAVWHSWLDDAIYLVTGGTEQPDPGLIAGQVATVVVRSKETTSRLVTVGAVVESLTPGDSDWEAAIADLAKTRLNLVDPAGASARWATDPIYRLYRLRPFGPLIEGPGTYSAESRRAAPVPTPATTAGAKPKVLHRRHGSGRPLS
jgi:hypothetical protein